MRAIGYIRVSTEGQAREGVSLAAQRERIGRYCDYSGLELAGIVEDAGASGAVSRSRAGFVELLDRVEAGEAGAVVVYDLSRLHRETLTLLAFERFLSECGVALHTAEGQISTGTPEGWLGFANRALWCEFERRQIQSRTRGAMDYKRRRGEVVGAVPYGSRRRGVVLVPDASEQGIIKQARRLYRQGRTLAEICRAFQRRGITTRGGRKFTPQQIKNILPGYAPKWRKGRTLAAQRRALWRELCLAA
jgi:site-specific DNA recombinase